MTKLGERMTLERKQALTRYLELAGKYFGLKFSEATFAGAILQVAYLGIRLFSPPSRDDDSTPANCQPMIRSKNGNLTPGAVPFCIGPERHGIPMGLIIYAARNQYNHWDDENPHEVQRNVFRALSAAFRDDMWADLAFDLGNATISAHAGEVLLVALAWDTYDKYLHGMRLLLPASQTAAASECH